MEVIRSKFQCPACDRSILNRKIDRCLYCGATLPQELLFSPEKIVALDEEARKQEERRKHHPTPQTVEQPGFLSSAIVTIDTIDIISDIAGLFD
ncbi:MAG: hypothetical protein Q7K26_03975 [bacterium]|nr:hypothetical protein [bacterium]